MNRLIEETSPYLKQHAGNPVDWYPWGQDAFDSAVTENKPILLSIGYSTCHWCHVMAHESFEDPNISAFMNANFINIKVDREERPDVDSVYMTFTQALTGQGGWPMTIFLTPNLEPFYAGTYYPPEDSHGRPGFKKLLNSISLAWINHHDEIKSQASHITNQIKTAYSVTPTSLDMGTSTLQHLNNAMTIIGQHYDHIWGGFGSHPKFPAPSNLEFLMAYSTLRLPLSNDAKLMATNTLDNILSGGIYDHLGGGFSRYSVDRTWTVPHFEKMLYDNASLAKVLVHAHALHELPDGESSSYSIAAGSTLDYLLREMCLDPSNEEGLAFYSAQDADSEGIEGKFFLWTKNELIEQLGETFGNIAADLYSVSSEGNFYDPHHPELTNRNVLTLRTDYQALNKLHSIKIEDLPPIIEHIRVTLFNSRQKRVSPSRDNKILTSWNGLAISAFAEAGRILSIPKYIDIAERNAIFIHNKLWSPHASPIGPHLFHTYANSTSKILGQLEDYSYLGLGLIDLYKATGNHWYLNWAKQLLEIAIERFLDKDNGGFFDTAIDSEELIMRPKAMFDSSTPAANAAAGQLAAILARYFNRPDWTRLSWDSIKPVLASVDRAATALGTSLLTLTYLDFGFTEVAIVGTPTARHPLEREVNRRYLPLTLMAITEPDPNVTEHTLELFSNRMTLPQHVNALAYVCRLMVCDIPADTVTVLSKQLSNI